MSGRLRSPMRPSDFPDNVGVALLRKLIARHDRSHSLREVRSLRVEYGEATGSQIEVAQRLLVEAEQLGAISVERPKKTPHILRAIKLQDAAALTAYLGIESAATTANTLFDRIAPLLAGSAAWIQDEIEAALAKWGRGERAFRIAASEADKVEDLTRLLIAIDHGADGRDLRTFSKAAGVDSKAFERHRGTIVQIARRVFGWDQISEEETLSRLGFRPFFQLVHIAGPVAIPAMGLDASGVAPYLGLPPMSVEGLELTRPIDAILTIENLASFNRHSREVREADVVVLYTGGFPGRPVIETLRRLLLQAPHAPVHHWGDIDAGGVRIFRTLEQRVERAIVPHLMDRHLAEAFGRPAEPVRSLASIAVEPSGIADLALYLSGDGARQLEQETLAPAPCS